MLSHTKMLFLGSACCLCAVVSTGCSRQEAPPPPEATSSTDWTAGLEKEVVNGLSQLTPTDRTAALAQRVCPVTNKPLGSMGKPVKVTVEGREVFLCCAGCEEPIKSDPSQYLGKLETQN